MNRDDLIKTERLCNIKVDDDKRETIAQQLQNILDNIKKIYEIETAERFYRPTVIKENDLREDIKEDFKNKDIILNAARALYKRFIVVPKVIGGNNDK